MLLFAKLTLLVFCRFKDISWLDEMHMNLVPVYFLTMPSIQPLMREKVEASLFQVQWEVGQPTLQKLLTSGMVGATTWLRITLSHSKLSLRLMQNKIICYVPKKIDSFIVYQLCCLSSGNRLECLPHKWKVVCSNPSHDRLKLLKQVVKAPLSSTGK